MTTIEAQALAVTLEARALALWEQEKRDRRWMRATWTQARHDRMTELRALLAIRRSARRLARQQLVEDLAAIDRLFPEQADPITAALAEQDRSYPVGVSYHDYQAAGPVR